MKDACRSDGNGGAVALTNVLDQAVESGAMCVRLIEEGSVGEGCPAGDNVADRIQSRYQLRASSSLENGTRGIEHHGDQRFASRADFCQARGVLCQQRVEVTGGDGGACACCAHQSFVRADYF